MVTTALSLYISSILSFGNTFTLDKQLPPLAIKSITINQEVAPIPLKKPENIAPIINATSVIAIDLGSGEILYEKNSKAKRQIASLTKIMTAIIIMEENDLNDVVTVSGTAASTAGSKMWLHANEKIKVQNLLYGLMVHSGNDAAVALAEHNAGSVESFVQKMNKKAKELKLYNTHYANPMGFDSNENYSSAHDLSILSKYAHRKSFIRHATSLTSVEVRSETGGIIHNLESTNKVLGSFLNFQGLKTGHTEQAGECFVGIAANKDGRQIMTIVLNSPNRFRESKILADWVFRSYIW